MKKTKALAVSFVLAVVCAFTGCISTEQQSAIHEKIVEYIQTDGQQKAIEYIDQLVADGRLGAKNAEEIKAAIPGIVAKLQKEKVGK